MAVADWNTEEDWEVLHLGGVRIPGVAFVHVQIQSGLDAPKPRGGKRPPIRDEGEPPAKISIEVVLTHEEFSALQQHRAILRPKGKGGARDPQAIVHPNTAFWGIQNCSIGNVSSPMPEPGGFLRLKIEALEWTHKPEKVKKPKEKPKDKDADAWAPFVDARPALDTTEFRQLVEPQLQEPPAKPSVSGAASENF